MFPAEPPLSPSESSGSDANTFILIDFALSISLSFFLFLSVSQRAGYFSLEKLRISNTTKKFMVINN
jgi:hypothetical protein